MKLLEGATKGRYWRSSVLLTAICAIGLTLAGTAGALSFGPFGSGAGQTKGASGVAVDRSNGNVYVADSGNNRIAVFSASGAFLRAFGWGVADGQSAEPQICTTTCFAGLPGGGAGQFNQPTRVAVDNDPASPSYRDVYVFDSFRVQRFSSSAGFIASWGGGVISGGAAGTANVVSGSNTLTSVQTTKKRFVLSQVITGPGIPPGTRIVGLGEGSITMSKPATASAASAAIAAPEGAGSIPVNEQQTVTNTEYAGTSEEDTYQLRFTIPDPSPSTADTAPIAYNASATQVQAALIALPNLGPGDVSVTSPNPGGVAGVPGGPYTITFQGTRFADTDVAQLTRPTGGTRMATTTDENGGSAAEVCAAAVSASCVAGVAGKGAGQFGSVNDPLAVSGPAGTIYVGDSVQVGESETDVAARVQRFEADGSLLDQFALPENQARVSGIATDGTGNSYVATDGGAAQGVRKYSPAGNFLLAVSAGSPGGLAVDSAGNLFLAENFEGPLVRKYSPAGTQLKAFGYGEIQENSRGLAAYSTGTGDLFVAQSSGTESEIIDIALPPPGPVILPEAGRTLASPVGSTKATLKATVNPEGKASECHFEYVDDATYQAEAPGNGFDEAESSSIVACGADFKLHDLSVKVEGLTPETVYHLRAVAVNIDGGPRFGPEATFETRESVEVSAMWATEVGADAARLHAEVNPLGIAATGVFQYVDDATYRVSGFDTASEAPGKEFNLGSGEEVVTVGTQLFPLASDTLYHYRFFAVNSFNPSGVPGAERTFTTYAPFQPETNCPNQSHRFGASAALADCRAYEMASPVNKNNSDIKAPATSIGDPAALNQSAGAGGKLTYSTFRAFGDAQSAPYVNQYLATRKDGVGWLGHAITPPREGPSHYQAGGLFNQFKAFSEDLSMGWLVQDAEPTLDPAAPPAYPNLYRRDNLGESYEALVTDEPHRDPTDFQFELQGVSADGSHAVFTVSDRLGSAPNLGAKRQLYLSAKGSPLRLVSVLPSGVASKRESSAGTPSTGGADYKINLPNALSADGTTVYWSEIENPGSGPLYVRFNADQEQSKVSAGVCTEAEKACTLALSADGTFWSAAADGSTAIFSEGGNLYEFDLEAGASHPIAGQVGGVLGAGSDASHVYFFSAEALGGKGEAGKRNLYLYDGGTPIFVATLASSFVDSRNVELAPGRRTSRVSPDGLSLVFMSTASLTGYDNIDADPSSGEADAEVYLYDAAAPKLRCVSCNPSGARPSGHDLPGTNGSIIPVAAQIPGWSNQLHPGRVLSEDGTRVFFESYDSLLPRDSNGKLDVYEWEAPGSGRCTAASNEFFEAAEGCISLISSGQSPQDSEFLDAGVNGDDVFFTTLSKLLPQDPGLIDIYDARVGGGLPIPPTPMPPCEGEACQSPPAPPNDPTPSSSSYFGPANPVPKKPAAKKKQKKGKKHNQKKQKKNKKRNGEKQGKSGKGPR